MKNEHLCKCLSQPEADKTKIHAVKVPGSHAVHISDLHTATNSSRFGGHLNNLKARQSMEKVELINAVE